MENILEIIYNLSINNNLLNIYKIDKILEILIDKKNLNEYILNIDVQQIRSNNLASYSNYYKKIIIYSNVIKKMINNIDKNLKIENSLTKNMYINLSILQVILHELEHVNQERIINYNTLEAFILRISQIVVPENQIYEVSPAERFAEIKSYNDILKIINSYRSDLKLSALIKNDELQRKIRGYHYCDNRLHSPIVSYFEAGNKKQLLSSFEWYSNNDDDIKIVSKLYDIDDCLFYGFPISDKVYCKIMNEIIINLDRNYKNKIKIKKNINL